MLITMRRLASLAAETERLKDLNDLHDQLVYAEHMGNHLPILRERAYTTYFEALERWRLAYMDQPVDRPWRGKTCGLL